MAGQADPPSPIGHIPGDVAAIDDEIRRLDDIKERLWSVGDGLRMMTVDGWAGAAHDSFDDFRYRFAHRWLVTGDRHDEAARALERYQATLLEVRRRVATAELAASNPAALADIARWNDQLSSEASVATTTIRRAGRAFADLPRVLNDAPNPVGTPVPPQRPTRTTTRIPTVRPDDGRRLNPRFAGTDPTRFRHELRELSGQVLAADFVAAEPGMATTR